MRLRLKHWDSPVAPLLVVSDADGVLRSLEFGGNEARMRRLMGTHYGECAVEDGPLPKEITAALKAYFGGEIEAVDDLRVETNGTPFQRKVWKALREIPAGKTISYGRLATNIGRPTASRAVGMANHCNPIAIVVPCHRVIGANGSLTGYASGLQHKEWLLEHERRYAAVGV